MSPKCLAIGTAQFGLQYGVANQVGQVEEEDVAAILKFARESGVDTLDTAIAYGNSESLLGHVGVSGWRVISKLPAIGGSAIDVKKWVFEAVTDSLVRLKVDGLYALLLHRPLELLGQNGPALQKAMYELKEQGLVKKIGVSIYGPDEIAALHGRFAIELVQAPFNVVDRRMQRTGWIERLNQSGVEVHLRSIFLQGLLLMPAAMRPAYFARWSALWERWGGWLKESRSTPLESCLATAASIAGVSRIVVGVDSYEHCAELIRSVGRAGHLAAPEYLACDDVDLVDPSRWKT